MITDSVVRVGVATVSKKRPLPRARHLAYACRVDYAFRLLNPPVADAGSGYLVHACTRVRSGRLCVCLTSHGMLYVVHLSWMYDVVGHL